MAVTTAAVIGAAVAVKGSIDQKKASKKALKLQEGQNESNAAFIAEKTEEARQAVLPLFAGAQEARNVGFGGAANILQQAAPAQIGAFQQGNVAAQQALIGGQPRFSGAILGLPGGQPRQPQSFAVDTSFLNQPIPSFTSGAAGILEQEQAALAEAQLRQQGIREARGVGETGRFIK